MDVKERATLGKSRIVRGSEDINSQFVPNA